MPHNKFNLKYFIFIIFLIILSGCQSEQSGAETNKKANSNNDTNIAMQNTLDKDTSENNQNSEDGYSREMLMEQEGNIYSNNETASKLKAITIQEYKVSNSVEKNKEIALSRGFECISLEKLTKPTVYCTKEKDFKQYAHLSKEIESGSQIHIYIEDNSDLKFSHKSDSNGSISSELTSYIYISCSVTNTCMMPLENIGQLIVDNKVVDQLTPVQSFIAKKIGSRLMKIPAQAYQGIGINGDKIFVFSDFITIEFERYGNNDVKF